MAQWVKNQPAKQEMQEARVLSLDWGRSLRGGHDNPLQFSCLENSMDREAWWATVHGDHKESDVTERTCKHTSILISLNSYNTVGSSFLPLSPFSFFLLLASYNWCGDLLRMVKSLF